MSGEPTVLVFLKWPRPGRVKTRLAAAIGNDEAAALYRRWIGETFATLQPLRARARVVGYYDGAERCDFDDWLASADAWWPQPAGDLGERLTAGFETAFAEGCGPVLAIGTDCPELDAPVVGQAFDELRSHESVFGPCPDGGYYLVGTAAHLPGFFIGVRWSGSHTLADHLAHCRANGWSASLLPVRHDIDTADDWHAYLARIANSGGRDPGSE